MFESNFNKASRAHPHDTHHELMADDFSFYNRVDRATMQAAVLQQQQQSANQLNDASDRSSDRSVGLVNPFLDRLALPGQTQ